MVENSPRCARRGKIVEVAEKRIVAVLGDLNWDLLFFVPALPKRGGEVLSVKSEFRLGGAATNTARWLAQLGFEVRLFAAVGTDPLGDLALRELEKAGISWRFLRRVPGKTGICCALVDERGERTLLTSRGANASLSPPLPPDWLADAAWLHISGYALLEEGGRAAAKEALAQARTLGIPVSLDPGMLVVHGHGGFLKALGPVEVFLPNREEAQALTGEDAPEKALFQLLRFGRLVFLKLGGGGCLAGDGILTHRVPAPLLTSADPVGAGDAFNAGVIAASLRGGSLLAQAGCGVLLGTLAASASVPTPETLERLKGALPPEVRREVQKVPLMLGA